MPPLKQLSKFCLPHIGRPNESTLIVGGILSFVIILIIGVSTLGFIILIIQIRGRKPKLYISPLFLSPNTHTISFHRVREGGETGSKSVPTANNAAYGVVVSQGQRSSGDVAMYEIVGQPSSSSSARPTGGHPSDSAQRPPIIHTHYDPSPYDVISQQ